MINAQSAAPFTPQTGPVQPSVAPTPVNPVMPQAPMTEPMSKPPQKKGFSKGFKMALAGLLLLIVVVGGGVGFYLNQQSQDVRQQASETKPTETPIVRPPETTAPSDITATCVKKAYLDNGTSNEQLVETKSFNTSQGILFRISVTKQDDKVIPLVITDDYRKFTAAGYEFVSAEALGTANTSCNPDTNYNSSNPGFYRCTWNGAEQGQTLVLQIRLRPTVLNFGENIIEPEKIEATNSVEVMPVEQSGNERPTEGLTGTESETPTREAPTGTSNNCSTTVLIPGTSGVIPTPSVPPFTLELSCTNNAYENAASNTAGNYAVTRLTQKSVFKPGDIVVYQVAVRNNTVNPAVITFPISGNGSNYLTFLDSTCGDKAYDSATKTITCPALDFTSSTVSDRDGAVQTKAHLFRMKIADNAPTARVSLTAVVTQPALIPSTDPFIRNCPVDISIEAGGTPAPTPTPAVGCNQACNTNADCSNPNHVCSTQGSSKVCRLSSNLSSTSCSASTTTGTATPTPTMSTSTGGSQPTLPSELPQTGAGDINNWVKAGLGTLGLGILFLLLL